MNMYSRGEGRKAIFDNILSHISKLTLSTLGFISKITKHKGDPIEISSERINACPVENYNETQHVGFRSHVLSYFIPEDCTANLE